MPALRSAKNAALICDMIADRYTLRQIAREMGLKSASAITNWVREDDEFHARYARAMELRAEAFAEEIVEISDDGTNDWMQREQGDQTVTVVDHEHIQRSKLRVDTRKWLMAKMAPKRYGDKLTAEVTGKDGESLIPPETDPSKIALALLSVLRPEKPE